MRRKGRVRFPPNEAEERQFVQALLSNDPQALKPLAEKTKRLIGLICSRFPTLTKQDAEDVAQKALENFFEHYDPKRMRSFNSFYYTVGLNAAKDLIRSKVHQVHSQAERFDGPTPPAQTVYVEPGYEEVEKTLAPDDNAPSGSASSLIQDSIPTVLKVLEGLRPKQRLVYLLKYDSSLSQKEIKHLLLSMGEYTTPKAVESALSRVEKPFIRALKKDARFRHLLSGK